MARRRKYFTDEQKLEARKARQLRYYYRNKLGLNNLLVNKKPKAVVEPIVADSVEKVVVSEVKNELGEQ